MPLKRRTAASSDDQEDTDGIYKNKRERNNKAVKKCREQTNQKAKETMKRVEELKVANIKLEATNEMYLKYIDSLKKKLLNKNHTSDQCDIEVKKLQAELDDNDVDDL